MKRTTLAACGLLTCLAGTLAADGFSEMDRALIAGKGIFPEDGGDSDEGTLPGTDISSPSDDTDTDSEPAPVPPPDKGIQPDVGKDAPFPTDDDGQ